MRPGSKLWKRSTRSDKAGDPFGDFFGSSIDTSLVSGTVPPQAVFQTERYGEFTYTLGGFTAGARLSVTLYFA